MTAFATVCHSNYQNLQKVGLSSSMAMYSVMRDTHDARRVPMERGLVAFYS